MPAEGRQNAAGLRKGDQILVERAKDGKPVLAKAKTLALVATVEDITTTIRNGRKRYVIHTDLGKIEDLAPIQTFWLATEKQKLKLVPPAQFRPAELVTAGSSGKTRVVTRPQAAPVPVQMPPGFVNGQRGYEATPEGSQARCVDRSGCQEAATQQVVGRRHIRYCPRHGAEFEVRQQYMVDPWKLEAVR